MTPDWLQAIRARCAAATGGAWSVRTGARQDRSGRKYGAEVDAHISPAHRRPWQSAGYVPIVELFHPSNPSSVNDPRELVQAERLANGDFIAHSRADVPGLLDLVTALAGALEEAQAILASEQLASLHMVARAHGCTYPEDFLVRCREAYEARRDALAAYRAGPRATTGGES